MSMVLLPLFHTQSLGRQPRDMEERNLIQPHRIQWYRFPAAPLNARSSKPFPAWIAVTLSFPLSGRWDLSPSFPLCVSQCPTDDLRTLRRLPLFYYAKRGYLLCTTRNLNRLKFPMDDGELAAVGAITFRKQCLLWCLVQRICSKNYIPSAPKQRLDSLTGMTPMVFKP